MVAGADKDDGAAGAAPSPPGPRGLPLVGYLPFLGYDLHKKFTELAGVYGPIYKLRLGNKLFMVVSSPRLAKEIVRDKDTIFADRDPPISARVFTYGGNDIAWSSYGPPWTKMRKIFVREMLNPVDFGELAYVTSINAILGILLGGGTIQGEKWTDFVSQFRSHAAEMMELEGKLNVSDLFPVLARFDLQGIEIKAKRLAVTLDQFLQYAIEQRSNEEKAHMDEAKDFLQILLDLNKHEDPATSITMDQVKAIIMLARTYGPILKLQLGYKLGIIVSSPDLAREVLKDHDITFANRDVPAVAQIAFYGSKVGSPITVGEQTFLTILNVITSMLWGGTVQGEERGSLGAEFRRIVADMTELLGAPNISDFFPALARFDLQSLVRKISGLTPRFDHIFDRMIEKQLNFDALGDSSSECKGFLQFMLKVKDEGDVKAPLTMTHIKALLMENLAMSKRMFLYFLATLLHSFDWKLPASKKEDLTEKFGIVLKLNNPLVVTPTPRFSNPDLYQ
ncbi:hypothetical protein SADUNF_Sadunf01G0094600 [Salix dunnii]|uniref:Uncharacterized protein n=1 Tax=Salix dunnii TaxID=1413687 RepID=A0A835TJW9_9ROSI|nr:hypothetical protein SADUNF_Sadunf01G0094600 [Salix dunnii]